jgi:outer membrane protein insertion porin family
LHTVAFGARDLGRKALSLVLAGLAVALAGEAPAQERPVVAILPFRVHSAKPIEYLGESLANLVRTRLESSGQVRVLDPDAVAAQLDPAALGETREPALREIAERVGADWVVSGSLTELAGHFSLDVRLTPANPGLDGRTLVLTAEEDEELLARVDEVSDGIVEGLAGAAPPRVVQVEIEGAAELTPELLPRLSARAGEPYDAAAVRDDLALLRAESSVASASVETERGPDGVILRYRVVRSDRILAQPGRPPGERVAEVRVRGNRRIEAAAIQARIGTKAGERLQQSQIAKDVREVNALGFFRNVRVFTDDTPQGWIVTFEVEENPVVRQISISGNENIDGDKIRDILTLATGATLDYPLLFENRERVAALYRAEGYYLAEVSYEIEPLSEHSVGIHFIVDENQKLKLRSIEFVGNEHFDDSDLTQGFKTKRWRWWSYATSWFDRSGTYSEPVFLQDLQTVQKKYADAGYVQAEVGDPDVIPSPKGIEVKVRLTEGQQFRVGSLDIAGDETVDTAALEEKLPLEEGEVFNRSYLSDSVTALTDYYTDRGFYFASVQPLSNLSDQEQVIDVIFQVRKGPLYFIREIDISGNTTTVDPVVRREVRLVEGQLYSQRQVMLSRLRIESLGFFEEVDVRMEPTEVPEQLDMEVHVVEKPTGSFSFGAGYSSQDGFVGTGSLQQSNLFGRGYAANASVDFGGSTQRFFLSLIDPYFLGSDWSLAVTGFLTNLNYESFEQEQLGAELSLGHALTDDNRTRGLLRYIYARRKITDDNRLTAASMIFRDFVSGALDTSLVELSVVSDTRNDRFSPNAGWNIGATVGGAGPLGFARFLRTEGRAIFYLGAPRWLLDRSSFVVGTRMGYALPFNSIGDWDLPTSDIPPDINESALPLSEIDTDLELPLSERYFLGGLGEFQLRGFRARSVGPRRPILYQGGDPLSGLKTNLWIPVGTQLQVVDRSTGSPEFPPDTPIDDLTLGTGGECFDDPDTAPPSVFLGNGNGVCNTLTKINDIDDTDVIGGNKFISSSIEYRFPISETLGLQGVVFFDTGNAFEEGDNLFDVTEWRYGSGVGVQWFSPFGPLAVVLGFPLDRVAAVEDSPVFEFSVGGRDF